MNGRNFIRPNNKLLGSSALSTTIYLDKSDRDWTTGDGELLSKIAGKLNELNPEMFKRFEEQFLSKANAIKYNGTETIIPLRIEDIEGNVVWSRR